ncbi:ABC transporter ATP-binding protein [Brevibacterium sp.]|jgi:teichoic acid transport system ATP-binding protein|uniref:ABC transporter ATP-binding protein n=1 Tax=Brevibacterium sp. TaxID=1701 RepID=UPI002606E86A|nr:ABC transporter ATP-binding protein [Brevibacterium sp.]
MSDEHTVEPTTEAAPAEAATTEATNAEAPDNGAASTDEPVVICDGVHVRYKTLATGKKLKLGGGGGMLKRQRGIQEVHALKGVSFVAHRNESIGVIGTNGSGKSTLMRSITGLTPTSEGTIYAKSRPNLLGVGAALIPDLSGARNIIIGSLALGLTRAQVEEKFDDIVEFTGLEDFIDLPMRTYSSGMSQRLKFAIATSVQHEILIVDEALNVGDKKFRDRSEGRIRSIRENAGTVFLVSHSMRSIKDTCNRTLWIEKGELRADGPTADVIKEYQDFNKAAKERGER